MNSDSCTTHVSGGGELPCAWINCPKGVVEGRITAVTSSGHREYERVSVPSYQGETRFYWRLVGAGWLSIASQVRTRELALVQIGVFTATHVYHYTTASAFKNIVESQELWLSDYEYLNDSSEVRHGLALAGEIFDEFFPGMPDPAKNLLTTLLPSITDDKPRIFVACFSFERDSLTQWKGYGESSLGVAFGIDPIAFATACGIARMATFAPVLYSPAAKRHLLRTFVHDWTSLYALDIAESKGNPQSIYEKLLRPHFFALLAMMKDDAFRDEREFRIIYQEDPRILVEIPHDPARKRYRVSGPLIVPYTTTRDLARLRFGDGVTKTRIEVLDVIVGPHPLKDVAVSGIREFLANNGYHDILVAPSRVPYR